MCRRERKQEEHILVYSLDNYWYDEQLALDEKEVDKKGGHLSGYKILGRHEAAKSMLDQVFTCITLFKLVDQL